MNSQQPDRSQAPDDLRSALNWLITLAWCAATPVETVLHRNIGERYLGINALGGLLLLLLYGGLAGGPRGEGAGAVALFLIVYVCMCVCARISAFRRARRGEHVHSYSSGDPRLCRLVPKMDPENVKRYVEPFALFLTGAVLEGAAPALGRYLVTAAVALLILEQFRSRMQEVRTLDMRDAHLDARRSMERFHGHMASHSHTKGTR